MQRRTQETRVQRLFQEWKALQFQQDMKAKPKEHSDVLLY